MFGASGIPGAPVGYEGEAQPGRLVAAFLGRATWAGGPVLAGWRLCRPHDPLRGASLPQLICWPRPRSRRGHRWEGWSLFLRKGPAEPRVTPSQGLAGQRYIRPGQPRGGPLRPWQMQEGGIWEHIVWGPPASTGCGNHVCVARSALVPWGCWGVSIGTQGDLGRHWLQTGGS